MDAVSPQTGAPEIVLAENQPEYQNLPVAVYDAEGGPVLVSRWKFTEEERARIAAGEDLTLAVWTHGHLFQPVLLQVGQEGWKVERVECCATCEQPKSRTNTPGEETERGWPVCINPECPAFGEGSASACYRPDPAAEAPSSPETGS